MSRVRTIGALFPAPQEPRSPSTHLRAAYRFARRRILYDYLLYPYGWWKHKDVADDAEFSQSHIYTAFFRVPAQFDALLGPVLDALGVDGEGHRREPLRISVFAGSIGAEAYTVAAILAAAVPELDVAIECSDLHEENVERCRQGRYRSKEVLRHGIPPGLVDAMFDRSGDEFEVKESIKSRVRCFQADIVGDDLSQLHGPADVIFVQNVLCHLDATQGETALHNVMATAAPGAAIFMDGMPLESRERLSSTLGLIPVDFEIAQTHRQLRTHLPMAWWTRYYSVEPYIALRPNRLRRYATVFLKNRDF